MPRAFDEAELMMRVDDDLEFLGETAQMLAADGPALVQAIRRSFDIGDAPAVAREAHTLKGMISNFCAPAIHAAALTVEQDARAGNLAGLAHAIDALENDVQALIADLNDFLAGRATCGS